MSFTYGSLQARSALQFPQTTTPTLSLSSRDFTPKSLGIVVVRKNVIGQSDQMNSRETIAKWQAFFNSFRS